MKAFGYIRVSKLGEESISPEIQRDEISRYCAQKGWTVTEWFQDLDLSGRAWDRKKRRALDELMTRALAGECDVVVFYRVDRLSREEADFHPMLATLRRAGIHCDSPSNPNDGSPESDLIWSISAALAKYESVRLGARLRDAHRRLAKMGRWPGGPVPWGWRRVEDDGGSRLVVDPELLETRLWMHQRYQQGWALRRIARALNEKGVPTRSGGVWEDPTVRAALATPHQVGARVFEGELVGGGNIQPLIPLQMYERTMAAFEARKGKPSGGRPPRVPLTGRHVRCGTCGGPMYARYAHRAGDLYFQCRRRALGLCHRGPAVRAAWLVPEVERRLLARVRNGRTRAKARPLSVAIDSIAQEVKRLEEGLGRLASLYASDELLEEEYREARKAQLTRLSRAQERLARARTRAEASVRSEAVSQALRGLSGVGEEGWAALSVEAKRDIVDVLVESVTVYPKEEPRNRWAGPHTIRIEWR
jgi:site-specific DNA recombinase